MLENFSKRISGIVKTISGNARFTEANIQDALREVRIALLEADVAITIVKDFIESIKIAALGQKVLSSLKPDQAFIGIVRDKLIDIMGQENHVLNLQCTPPAVILMAGLQGVGKTTTAAKLAKRLKEINKKKVLLVSCDVYRPAAIKQLQILANSIEIECYNSDINMLPVDIATCALEYAKKHYFDILIVDTAGRLSIDDAMMQEISTLNNILQPIETLFIVDAMLGQDAVNTAKIFNDTVDITGVILTKIDGDARGGAILSIKQTIHKPIKFIATSEKITGLEPFYPDRMASRILGMGDVLSLIDEAKMLMGEEQSAKLTNKIKKNKKFDLNDFKLQFQQVGNMGGLSSIMDKLPQQLAQKAPSIINDKMIKKYIAIIDSMTKLERKNPEILKATRKQRIARGSGTKVQDINQLLTQFEQINTMMKKFGSGGLMKMLSGFSGMMPKLQ